MAMIVRLGDTGTHGGSVTTSCSKMEVEGALVAREGDIYSCPIHGPNPIVGHASKLEVEGHMVARHGDATACGATLISGATKYDVE